MELDGDARASHYAELAAAGSRSSSPARPGSTTRRGRRATTSTTTTTRTRGKPRGHRHERPAQPGAREGHLASTWSSRRSRTRCSSPTTSTEGAAPPARVELDRKSRARHRVGQPRPDDGRRASVREYDDTPAGFGRIAATTAKQVILQRLRDAEDELTFGEYAGREGDIVAGVIQQGKDPRNVLVDLGKLEAVLPPAEQVPGERYVHGERIRCYVRAGPQGAPRARRSPCPGPTRTWCGSCSRWRCPEIADGTVEIVAIAREAGHRTKIAVRSQRAGRQRQGRLHRPDGRPGAQRHERAARREDRHRRLVRRPGRVRGQRAVARPG